MTRVVRELRAHEGRLTAVGVAAASLLRTASDALAPVSRNSSAARELIQHIMALDEHLAPFLAETDTALMRDLLRLRYVAVWLLNELSDSPGRATEYGQRLIVDSARLLGPEDSGTMNARNELAGAYQAAGRLGEAIPLFEATLADRERVLGADHPDTLTSRNNLANPTGRRVAG